MKKNLAIILFVFSILSCDKEDIELGSTDITINSVAWERAKQENFYRTNQNTARIGIQLFKYNEYNEAREILVLNNISPSITQDTIFVKLIQGRSVNFPDTSTATFSTMTSDGDALLSFFKILPASEKENWLVLKKLNRKMIKGTFNLHFLKEEDWKSPTDRYPDTLLIKGTFLAKRSD